MSDDTDDTLLDAEDLDVTADERVRELDDGRFVVATGDGPPRAPPDAAGDDPAEDGSRSRRGGADAADRRAASLVERGDDYGFDAVLAVDGQTVRSCATSDDVAEAFEALVVGFARAVGGDLPPAEALGVLLAGMDAPVRLPERELHRVLARYGLSRDDSIDDLLAAVSDDHGFTLE